LVFLHCVQTFLIAFDIHPLTEQTQGVGFVNELDVQDVFVFHTTIVARHPYTDNPHLLNGGLGLLLNGGLGLRWDLI
jgi:hypothetical protein